MVESEVEKKKKQTSDNTRWWLLLGAVISILIAIASSYITNLLLYFRHIEPDNKSCHCGQEKHKFSGVVEDCCWDYETVNQLNEQVLHPSLQKLVKAPFFRYFKVKLWCDCPFWPDDGMCPLRDCSVCECPENEFPETFKKPFSRGLPSDDLVCQEGKPQATVDRTLDTKAFRNWTLTDNPWTNDDETDNADMTYVNLQLNPKRYTGYTSPSARRIWDAVYSENCRQLL